MTRGIGTALGVAVVTVGLHAEKFLGLARAGQELPMAALAAVALAATWAGLGSAAFRRRLVRGGTASGEFR